MLFIFMGNAFFERGDTEVFKAAEISFLQIKKLSHINAWHASLLHVGVGVYLPL